MPIDQAVGATSVVVNAGCVRGVEISALPARQDQGSNGRSAPTGPKTGTSWSSSADGVAMWNLNPNITVGGNIYIRAYPAPSWDASTAAATNGLLKGAFYVDADGFLRRCSNQIVVDAETGNPAHLDRRRTARPGSIYPDWTAGMSHSLSYRVSAGAVVQRPVGRQDLFDDPLRAGLSGQAEELAQGRYAGMIVP